MPLTRRRVIAGASLLAAAGLGGWAARLGLMRYYDGPVSDHFDGTHFFDRHGVRPKSLFDLARWMTTRQPERWPEQVPIARTDKPPARVDGARCRIGYVGHASMLLQTGGLNILLDPIWSERASPFTFTGPKRVTAPGIAFSDLPPIDVVLVSHGHYDHLDVETLSRLAAAHRPRVITPLGNDTIMRTHDAAIHAEGRDWGERIELSEACAVTLAPMRHWTARNLFDRNKALWAAFILETPAGRIYHVGDSGYGDGHHFKQARERHGPFRLAILPVGAYEPRWFMREQHMNPEEAVRAFGDCGAERALAHHHGTFQLTDEAIEAPLAALKAAREAAGVSDEQFRALAPGEAMEL
jgi:L-ascorbate metabolism protein UlaG (beta-lactamase superfamily)